MLEDAAADVVSRRKFSYSLHGYWCAGVAAMSARPKRKAHQGNSPRDKRRRLETALDDALKNTFPASDPVSIEQPAGRDLFRSDPLIEVPDDNPRGG
jgi:hypothetical protein